MDATTYAAEAEVEESHWWFVGRRRLFARICQQLNLSPDVAILDTGTSTGTNLRLLRNLGFTNVSGIDMSPEAIRYCAEKGLGDVILGDVCDLPFSAERFDLVLATDVIEHIEDDQSALEELFRVLKPGGFALLTVPAFPALWGLQDKVAHHKRRYRSRQLLERISVAGFLCRKSFHFNYLLFVPILAARQIISLLKIPLRSENDVNSPLINRILTAVFRFDVWSAGFLRPAFGVSYLALCRKPLAAHDVHSLSPPKRAVESSALPASARSA